MKQIKITKNEVLNIALRTLKSKDAVITDGVLRYMYKKCPKSKITRQYMNKLMRNMDMTPITEVVEAINAYMATKYPNLTIGKDMSSSIIEDIRLCLYPIEQCEFIMCIIGFGKELWEFEAEEKEPTNSASVEEEKNKVVVINDYDGFFEFEANTIASELPQIGITIEVNTMPLLFDDVQCEKKGEKTFSLLYKPTARYLHGNTHHQEVLEILMDWCNEASVSKTEEDDKVA